MAVAFLDRLLKFKISLNNNVSFVSVEQSSKRISVAFSNSVTSTEISTCSYPRFNQVKHSKGEAKLMLLLLQLDQEAAPEISERPEARHVARTAVCQTKPRRCNESDGGEA